MRLTWWYAVASMWLQIYLKLAPRLPLPHYTRRYFRIATWQIECWSNRWTDWRRVAMTALGADLFAYLATGRFAFWSNRFSVRWLSEESLWSTKNMSVINHRHSNRQDANGRTKTFSFIIRYFIRRPLPFYSQSSSIRKAFEGRTEDQ